MYNRLDIIKDEDRKWIDRVLGEIPYDVPVVNPPSKGTDDNAADVPAADMAGTDTAAILNSTPDPWGR